MNRTWAGAMTLALVVSGCRHDDRRAPPSPSPAVRSVVLGPVRFPMPDGWVDLGSSCPGREVTLAAPPEPHCADASKPGVAIWAGAASPASGQSRTGTVAGHPVHLGRYEEERSYEIVVSFDDAGYGLVIWVALNHTPGRSDRDTAQRLLQSLVDA